MSKQTTKIMPALSIKMTGPVPQVHIKNYDNLIQRAIKIRDAYQKATYSDKKQARDAYRTVNRAMRNLNKLRKMDSKPFRVGMKQFKAKIDKLINILKGAKKVPKSSLNIYKRQRLQGIASHLQPIMDTLCTRYDTQAFKMPKECLKISLSKQKRYVALENAVKQHSIVQKRQKAKDIGGYAVYKPTGAIVGHYHKLDFIGDDDQLQTLLELAKAHHITLRKE